MHDECPACGGSTSVGTSPRGLAVEKSRRRAIGVSKTTSCGLVHEGGRRDEVNSSQRGMSKESILPVKAATMHCAKPLAAALHPSSQLAISAEEGFRGWTGGHCETASMVRLLKRRAPMDSPPVLLRLRRGSTSGGLLQEGAGRRRVRVGNLAGEVRLRVDQRLEPFLLAQARDLALKVDRPVHGLLIRVNVQIARLTGRGKELLVEVLGLLERRIETRRAVLGLRGCHESAPIGLLGSRANRLADRWQTSKHSNQRNRRRCPRDRCTRGVFRRPDLAGRLPRVASRSRARSRSSLSPTSRNTSPMAMINPAPIIKNPANCTVPPPNAAAQTTPATTRSAVEP